MNCKKATSPIDITKNVAGDCDLKCEYSFNYARTNLLARNKGDYILFRPTVITNTSDVIYNSDDYTVRGIRLYQPSLHSYGRKKADAELIITHTNISGAGSLIVCVPIMKGASSDSMLNDMVNSVARLAPTEGSNAGQITKSNFSLNNLVPNKPYFSYTGTLPFPPCNGEYDYVVFNIEDALKISNQSYRTLQRIIVANQYKTRSPRDRLFYNKDGPSTGKGKDEIYIDCKPTGSDGETLIGQEKGGDGSASIQEFFKSKIFYYILSFLIGIILIKVIFKVGNIVFKKIGETNVKKSSSS